MIALIVGDFCVGKDLVANLLLKKSLQHHDCEKFEKIKSYTTREPRYEGEDTHIFCTMDDYYNYSNIFNAGCIVAETQINNNYYFTIESQFDPNKVSLYVVDDKGIQDVVGAEIDDVYIIEVVRPVWLRDCPKERLNRDRQSQPYEYKFDYRIINDGSMEKLEASVLECFNALLKVKKSL